MQKYGLSPTKRTFRIFLLPIVMDQSSRMVSLADLKRKRTTVEARISQLQEKIQEEQKELDRYDWATKELFSDPNENTPKRMTEEVLLASRKAMKPMELYEEIKKLGHQGKPQNIYIRLMKWKNQPNTSIVSVGRGLYAHRNFANDLRTKSPVDADGASYTGVQNQ